MYPGVALKPAPACRLATGRLAPERIGAHCTSPVRTGIPKSSLTHFMFRQLSTTQGRWTTPDPAGIGAVSPGDPQTWNRYAYVGNMPLNAVDPLGLTIGAGNDVFGS